MWHFRISINGYIVLLLKIGRRLPNTFFRNGNRPLDRSLVQLVCLWFSSFRNQMPRYLFSKKGLNLKHPCSRTTHHFPYLRRPDRGRGLKQCCVWEGMAAVCAPWCHSLTAHTCTGSGMQENCCNCYSTLFALSHFAYSPSPPNLPSIVWALHCYHILITLALAEVFLSFQAGHITWEMGATAAMG